MENENYLITSKGYKLPINDKNVNILKKELMVIPYTENAVRFPVFRISEKYIYVPKFYGINKFGLPPDKNIKEQIGIPVELNFKNTLREYQVDTCNKILNHLKKHGSGLASIYTGWGKTAAALWIAAQLGVKTLIIVHTDNLLEQWKERINDFLGIPNDEIGIIRGPKVDIENKKICIGMIQSISMKEYLPNTFKDFGLTTYDECFPPDTFIITNNGKKTISDLYKLWLKLKNDNNIEILSFNQESKIFEYKKLTYAWQKMNKKLIKIKCSKRIIKCTSNHKILTINGYTEAINLKIGDIIMCKYDSRHTDNIICPGLNNDQIQLLMGSILGDGSLQKTSKNRLRLRFIHGEKQKKYLEWKAFMFNIKNIHYIQKNGYARSPAYTFCTKCFDFPKVNSFDYIINNIDERGLAIWFMDDGSICKNNNLEINGCLIHSNSYDYNIHLKFITLFNRFNIEIIIATSRKYYYLRFNKDNALKLINLTHHKHTLTFNEVTRSS